MLLAEGWANTYISLSDTVKKLPMLLAEGWANTYTSLSDTGELRHRGFKHPNKYLPKEIQKQKSQSH